MGLITFGKHSITDRSLGRSGYSKSEAKLRKTPGGINLVTHDHTRTTASFHSRGPTVRKSSSPTKSFSENHGAREVYSSMSAHNTYHVNATKAGGVAALGYGGYKAYQHRAQIKAKSAQFGNHVAGAFHNSRMHEGNKT